MSPFAFAFVEPPERAEAVHPTATHVLPVHRRSKRHPAAAKERRLRAAAGLGDVPLLEERLAAAKAADLKGRRANAFDGRVEALTHSADALTGDTALHWAAENGEEAAVRLLIAYGADVDAVNRQSETPAHKAAGAGSAGVLRALGGPAALANLKKRDAKGRTPADVAVLSGHAVCAAVIDDISHDDQALYVKRRQQQELERQRRALRQQEMLLGRSMAGVEGGTQFVVPPAAHLPASSSREIGAGLRAGAVVPLVLAVGARLATRDYLVQMESAQKMQQVYRTKRARRELARRKAERIGQNKASTAIQGRFRGRKARRGMAARRRLRDEAKAEGA